MSTLPGDSTHRGRVRQAPPAGRTASAPATTGRAAPSAMRCCMRRRRCARWSAPMRSGWSCWPPSSAAAPASRSGAMTEAHPADPPGCCSRSGPRAPQRHGRAQSDPHRAGPERRRAAAWPVRSGVARYHPRRAVDPIEANALYGGRMSLNDSLIVVAADHHLERRRRLDRAGGRLHPDRLGHRLAVRPHVPRPTQRPARCWWAAAPPPPSPARSTRR